MKMISAFLIMLSFSSVSLAKHHEGHDGACKADVEKFCKDVKPGGGAIMKCLKEHKDQLSAECKAKGEKMKEKMKERMKEAHEEKK